MSGLPLPDGELPDGTISVRVIRGQLANNVTDHPVDLHQGDIVTTATTDANGRATFLTLNPGVEVYAVTELDGQRIQSQRFGVPGRGGVRLMLVGAADPTVLGEARRAGICDVWERVVDPDRAGRGNRRGLLPARRAQHGPGPGRAGGADRLRRAARGGGGHRAAGVVAPDDRGGVARRVARDRFHRAPARFALGTVLPYTSGSLAVSQRFPANLEALVMMVEKWGTMDVASAQISRRGDLSAEESGGAPYLLAGGPLIAAGEPLAFELTGLPHHNRMPTNLALAVAFGMLAIGTWGAFAPASSAGPGPTATRRRAAEARKEKLFADLVKVERQRRARKDRVDQALDTAPRATGRAGARVSGPRRSERCHHVLDQPSTSTSSRLTRSRGATAGGARSIGCR